MNFDDFIGSMVDLLINPAKEWRRIQNEETQDQRKLYIYLINRIAPAILLNVGTYFVGAVIIGARTPQLAGATYLPFVAALFASILLAAAYVGIIIVGAFIIRLIASSFESIADEYSSLKLAGFSLYPLLIMGSLHIIPGVRIGTLAGSFGIYSLYNGFTVLLGTPKEKSAEFTLVVALAMIGMLALAFYLVNAISGAEPMLRVGL